MQRTPRDVSAADAVWFVMGKARVTPLKQIIIPRQELTAAVVAVHVDQMLKIELQIPLMESVFWTDSTSLLKYIANETRRFHTVATLQE